jgi:hypothetical protein
MESGVPSVHESGSRLRLAASSLKDAASGRHNCNGSQATAFLGEQPVLDSNMIR